MKIEPVESLSLNVSNAILAQSNHLYKYMNIVAMPVYSISSNPIAATLYSLKWLSILGFIGAIIYTCCNFIIRKIKRKPNDKSKKNRTIILTLFIIAILMNIAFEVYYYIWTNSWYEFKNIFH